MNTNKEKEEVNFSDIETSYSVFEHLEYPVCILGVTGELIFGNKAYKQLFMSEKSNVHLSWEHPFYPEYRRRLAQSYLSALKGIDKHCFAIIKVSEDIEVPIEIYLFPMFTDGSVVSIMVLMKVVDKRLLSFDRSTLSIISEDNFNYDSLHFEFSPMPILRVDLECEIIQCSHSSENYLGYYCDDVIINKKATLQSLFPYDSERIKKGVSKIMTGETTFQRIGEAKILTRNEERKVANLILFPIIQSNEISAVEIIIEDVTIVRDLRDRINTMQRVQLISDITKGFLHSLNNTMNVIMSKTQLLLQITEKESVIEGIQLIEESVSELVDQTRRVQDFIAVKSDSVEEKEEPLVNIIEDAIEFSKMQFKVEDKEKRRSINIERKYFTSVQVKTDTRLLREIVISIILKVANFIYKKGTLNIELKRNHDLYLAISTLKSENADNQISPAGMVNVFSGINIREVAEKINLKIIEEESVEAYALKAIFPSRIIHDNKAQPVEEADYKLRDLDIIVVEDEISLQKILFELFDRMGNRVFICENGLDALEEFKKKHYDLVITDYGIAGLTGIELSAKVKEINEKTATVLLSGWSMDDMAVYKNVVDLFLPKPFKLQHLIKSISKIMHDKETAD